jgi:hypothetical protein
MDPLIILLVGAGALTYREINRKDYGVLTPSRDERYRNVMEHCHQPELLLEEAKLFNEYGLKAQATMLKRRAEWRARPVDLKTAHEEVYQKAIKSSNIPAILEVAAGFEGWTATKKAANLREHVRVLQETMLQEVAQKAAAAAEVTSPKKSNGSSNPEPFTGVIEIQTTIGDDT